MKKLFTLLYIIAAFSAKADYWTQKADFGGVARWAAAGFSIGNKGYIGLGANANITLIYSDFWEYDQTTNSWTQKADFGGIEREKPVGFSIANKGYIGTGLGSNFYKDFWEYDPATNIWTQKMDFGGMERAIAAGFSSNIKGYLGTGLDVNYIYHNDFWEWDPNTNGWTQKANFNGTGRHEACALWICPYGYIGLGTTQIATGTVSDFWKYNIATNTWTQVANFGAGLREMAVAFTIANNAYVGTGWINDGSAKKDFWEYTPDSACATGIEEIANDNFDFQISPNPVKELLVISYKSSGKENITITITDAEGKIVHQSPLTPEGEPQIKISVEDLSAGIYFAELNNGKQKAVKKFLKE